MRIPAATMDKLKYIADRNGRSANKEIEQLILRHIEAWEQQHGPITFEDGFVPRSRSPRP
ncbi:MAG: Arc family DNA-binding protein [Clostridia bacterium]|nr:Arc family DNA-binding protein [Clostridia bacterium]